MNFDRYYSDLATLVNIDSGTLDGHAGIDQMADFFGERFAAMGWIVKKYDLSPDAGPCLICTNREAEEYDLLMIGHLDTVFTNGTAAARPFSMDEKYAYGPGVGDMKGGSLLIYYLLKDLPKEIHEKLNIVAVFNPDEETGSPYSRHAYAPYAKKSRRAFIYEGIGADGASCIERKGGLGYTVRFTGVAGHCGSVFRNGARSAVHEMGRWIVSLADMQDEKKGTSVNVGIASGGTKKNIVAPEAKIVVDIRIEQKEEEARFERAIEELREAAKERGIGVAVEKRYKPPLIPTEDAVAYAAHVAEIAERAGIPFSLKKRGGLSDGNLLAMYGAMCLDGIGPKADGSHSERDRMYKDSVPQAYELSMLLLHDLAKQK